MKKGKPKARKKQKQTHEQKGAYATGSKGAKGRKKGGNGGVEMVVEIENANCYNEREQMFW